MDQVLEWARNNLGNWALIKVYIACAVAGGSVLLGQAGLNLFGIGGDTDVDADVDADDLDTGDGTMGFISVRTLASFMTMLLRPFWGWRFSSRHWASSVPSH